MTLKFTPYRGKIEPVTKINKAEVKLFPDYIEVVFNYEFDKFDEGMVRPETTYAAHFIPKYLVSLLRSACYHTEDDSKELCQYVGLDVSGVADTIMLRCKSNKEADELYSELRDYLLMN